MVFARVSCCLADVLCKKAMRQTVKFLGVLAAVSHCEVDVIMNQNLFTLMPSVRPGAKYRFARHAQD
jgi:hypothetical protein